MATSTYQVALDAFTGPFDLLLHLIARRQVDIYEIPLAQITDDYLQVVRAMETRSASGSSGDALDLEVATEFLVVAATLLELKAARLLPGEDDPELVDLAVEARDLLYARLLDYRLYKEASGWLRERLAASDGYRPRDVALEPRYAGLRPEVTLPVDAEGLAVLAAHAFAERPDPVVDVSHLQPVRLTVREAAGMVVDELARAGGRATFAELTAGCRHRVEVVVYFLALLELYKSEHVDLEQATSFGDLVVTTDDETGVWTPAAFSATVDVPAADDGTTDSGVDGETAR